MYCVFGRGGFIIGQPMRPPSGFYVNQRRSDLLSRLYLRENKDIFQSVSMKYNNGKFGAFSRLLIHMSTLQGRLKSESAKCAIVTT